jgi:hypothetical protein
MCYAHTSKEIQQEASMSHWSRIAVWIVLLALLFSLAGQDVTPARAAAGAPDTRLAPQPQWKPYAAPPVDGDQPAAPSTQHKASGIKHSFRDPGPCKQKVATHIPRFTHRIRAVIILPPTRSAWGRPLLPCR